MNATGMARHSFTVKFAHSPKLACFICALRNNLLDAHSKNPLAILINRS